MFDLYTFSSRNANGLSETMSTNLADIFSEKHASIEYLPQTQLVCISMGDTILYVVSLEKSVQPYDCSFV